MYKLCVYYVCVILYVKVIPSGRQENLHRFEAEKNN